MKNTAKERTVSAAIKRAVCLALCLLMLASLLPTKAYAAPAKVTQEQAKKRIAQLQSELGDKYFTVNRKACNTSFEKNHGDGCNNCANSKVIKAGWFKSAVSLVPSSIKNCPEGHFCEYQKGKYGGNALGNQGCKSGTEHAQTKPGNHPKVHKNIQDRRKNQECQGNS